MQVIELSPKSTGVLVRTILKGAFPATKFSVTVPRYSMASSVEIRWTDGPTVKAVDALVGCLEMGAFNGMTDSYDYQTGTDRIVIVNGQTYKTGTRYVSTSRNTTAAFAQRVVKVVAAYWGLEAPEIIENGSSWMVDRARNQDARTKTGFEWSDLIYQAMGDRTRFQQEA